MARYLDTRKSWSSRLWRKLGRNGPSLILLSVLTDRFDHGSQWPYTYDACDVGTAPNQTFNGLPLAATQGGDPTEGGVLSFLPGQRLSRCTCKGESHPGPMHSDGTFVGRAAPEIDVFEAQVWFRLCIHRTRDLTNPRSRVTLLQVRFPSQHNGLYVCDIL